MSKTYTLTEEELEELIRERMEHRPVTPQGLFNGVCFDGEGILAINEKYPEIALKMRQGVRQKMTDPAKFIYTNKPKHNEVMDETRWSTISTVDVHNNIRHLTLNVFGKSNNRDLTEDEYELAQQFYSELKDWYLTAYEKRMEQAV